MFRIVPSTKIYPATKRESLAIYPAIIQLLSNYHPAKKHYFLKPLAG
jgi:hypothetical protein